MPRTQAARMTGGTCEPLNVPQLSARARTWLTRSRRLPRWGGEPVLQWLSAKTSRATVHAKLSLGFAVAFALVVAVGVFGIVQLNSVNNTSKDLWEGWLPKIEALHRIRSALIEHRVLATRRTQTTNLRHVPDIRQAMTTAQAAVLVEARSYQTWSAHPDERLEFLQFLALWDAYQASFEAVMPRLEVGEFEAARAEFEAVTVTVFERAVVRLDSLMAFTKGRIDAAAAGADDMNWQALRLMTAAILLAGLWASIGTVWASRNVSQPIVQVSEIMRRLAKGDYSAAIANDGARKDEIGVLIDAAIGYRESLMRGRHLAEQAELERQRLHAAVSNMPIGLAMYDAERRLIISNSRYAEIYRLAPELSVPGTPIERILRARADNGLFGGKSGEDYVQDALTSVMSSRPHVRHVEFNDGRVLSVTIQPMEGGGWVSTHEDVTERRRNEARIHHMARHDGLTDLPNRSFFKERINEALKQVPRGGSIAVLCIDLDRFKTINDTLGHPVGDALLRGVAERLRKAARDGDTIARFGGDEFAIIQVGSPQPQGSTTLAQRLIEMLGAPYEIEGHQLVIGCSIGVAIAPTDGGTSSELIRNADLALYRAKSDGRGVYRFFEPEMDARMQARRALEMDLRRALALGEFELAYQPIIDLASSKITCFEALLRWRLPNGEEVLPGDFLAVAEETGLIIPLGEWILRRACVDAAAWPEDIKVAVNLSPTQCKSDRLVDTVFRALLHAKVHSSRLELEITEGVLLLEREAVLPVLQDLHELGVKIVMDDFGTANSSISYLREFHFDKIKIDGSFIRSMSEASSLAIVRAVTGLGASLGIATTAEGVETKEQLDAVRGEGCTEVQGFLLSEPIPAADVPELLATLRRQLAAA